jgi:2-phospho-L-lactate guanylyltransferase
MQATAIIPVKRFGVAKQRLLEVLDRRQRAALVAGMLTDVIRNLAGSRHLDRVILVTGERRAEKIALHQARRMTTPLEVLRDPKDTGHPEAATLGVLRAKSLGATCAALLPGDCPLLDASELDAALERMEPGRVTVVPDRHGSGTNALLLSPPDAIAPGFGPDSCARHEERARRAGHRVEIEPLESLGLDLDTPEDLELLTEALRRQPERGPATAAELERLGNS